MHSTLPPVKLKMKKRWQTRLPFGPPMIKYTWLAARISWEEQMKVTARILKKCWGFPAAIPLEMATPACLAITPQTGKKRLKLYSLLWRQGLVSGGSSSQIEKLTYIGIFTAYWNKNGFTMKISCLIYTQFKQQMEKLSEK